MIDQIASDWHPALPPHLIHRAYRASNGELAWGKGDAMEVAHLLKKHGFRILGVDAWLPTHPGPTPLVQDWDEKHPKSIRDFITDFTIDGEGSNKPEGQPHFNFTVD